MLQEIFFLQKNTGAKLHISHVSNKESAFIIKIAKEQGIPVTAEVAPHHFTLDRGCGERG